MDVKDREFLRSHRKEICLVDFNAIDIAKNLQEKKILNANDTDTISSEEKDLRQKEKLLDLLPRCGALSFISFRESAKDLKLSKLYVVLGGDVSLLEVEEHQDEKQTLGMFALFVFCLLYTSPSPRDS